MVQVQALAVGKMPFGKHVLSEHRDFAPSRISGEFARDRSRPACNDSLFPQGRSCPGEHDCRDSPFLVSSKSKRERVTRTGKGFSKNRKLSALSPQFINGLIRVGVGVRHIIEPAPELSRVDHLGPIDPKRRVNCRLDIFGPSVASCRPARDRPLASPAATVEPMACPPLIPAPANTADLLHVMVAAVVGSDWRPQCARIRPPRRSGCCRSCRRISGRRSAAPTPRRTASTSIADSCWAGRCCCDDPSFQR